jgi:hypothetical protein
MAFEIYATRSDVDAFSKTVNSPFFVEDIIMLLGMVCFYVRISHLSQLISFPHSYFPLNASFILVSGSSFFAFSLLITPMATNEYSLVTLY